jgi:hypothetical protein
VSSSTSDRIPSHRALAAAVLAACLFLLPAQPAQAKEATARGRKANISWLEPDGTRKEVAARDIRYGYYERAYLSVPKKGRSYKDLERETKGIPLDNSYVKFSGCDTIKFTWDADPESGAPRLVVTVTKPNGKVRKGTGAGLTGALHPRSPYIGFTVGGVPQRIEINPVGPEEGRRGKPRLLLVRFTL